MQCDTFEWRNCGPAYVLNKFRKAVAAYYENDAPLEDRIYKTYFYFQLIPESDLPPAFRPGHRDIAMAFTRYPDPFSNGRASRIADAIYTIRKLSAEECMLIINRLTALIVEIEQSETRAVPIRRYGIAGRLEQSRAGARIPSSSQKKING